MSVKVRLTRVGRTHAPVYRIIVTDSRAKRDGKFIDNLGTYNPNTHELISFKEDKLNDWTSKGAIVTDSVKKIVKRHKAGKAA